VQYVANNRRLAYSILHIDL